MIDGVIIKKLKVHPDVSDTESTGRRGFLMEVLRDDDGLLKRFGQTTFTVAYPGTIKAFHWHKHQNDLWFIASGTARIVLHDLRQESRTRGRTDVFMAGTDAYVLIVIPPGVAHGYQVVSDEPVLLFYHTDRSYNPDKPDEERINYDDPRINFDWLKKTNEAIV